MDSGLDPDIWHYCRLYLIPETKDSEFESDDFQTRVDERAGRGDRRPSIRTLAFDRTSSAG